MGSRKTVSQSKSMQDAVERLIMQCQWKQTEFRKNVAVCSSDAFRKKDTSSHFSNVYAVMAIIVVKITVILSIQLSFGQSLKLSACLLSKPSPLKLVSLCWEV